MFLQVKTNEVHGHMKSVDIDDPDTAYSLLNEYDNASLDTEGKASKVGSSTLREYRFSDDKFGASWSPTQKRVVGLTLAGVTGIFFGCSFNPAQWVIDNRFDGEDNSLDYVFPHFCGILLASWVYTILYFCIKHCKGHRVFVNPDSFLPATLSGSMWGIAEIAWFVANGKLGFAVAFPIITSGPGFIGSMYGIFLFQEITGQRNISILAAAFLITVPGLICVALSH